MKKENIPLILIIISFILTVANIIKAEINDDGFWLGITSGVLLITVIYFMIRKRRKQKL